MPEVENGGSQSEAAGGSPANAPRPEETAQYWQDKYNGLLGHNKKVQEKADKLTLELAGLREQTEGQIATLTGEVTNWKSQAETHQKTASEAAAERDTLKRQRELGVKIRTNFPALASLYDKNLLLGLETMNDEQLTAYLTEYAADREATRQKDVKDDVAGSVPPPPNTPGNKGQAMTLGDAMKATQTALTQYGAQSSQYKAAMETYMAVLRNPNQ